MAASAQERALESGRRPGRPLCRIFLCHNSLDKPFIKDLADRLELDFGVAHFLDAFAIPTAEKFRPWIERALQESSGWAIFLGANGWGPTHLWEAGEALARRASDPGFRLIPVALPGIREKDMRRLGDGSLFRDVNWADLRSGMSDADALDKLYATFTGEPLTQDRGPARLTSYQIRSDAARWKKSKELDRSILYRGRQLTEAQRIIAASPDLAAEVEITAFLLASAMRQRRIWRNLVFGVSLVCLALLTLAAIAEHLREVAEDRLALAVSRQLAVRSRAEPAPVLSLLIAKERPTQEAEANPLERLQRWPKLAGVLRGDLAMSSVVTDAGAHTLVAGTANGTLLVWPLSGLGGLLLTDRVSVGAVDTLAPDPRTGEIWAGLEDGRVLVWKKDGRFLPVQGIPPGLDVRQAARVNTLGLGPKIGALAFSDAGGLVAVGTAADTGNATVFFVDRRLETVVGAPVEVPVPRVGSLDFDRGSRQLVIGTGFGRVFVVDVAKRSITRLPDARLSEVMAARFIGPEVVMAVDAVGRTAIWRTVKGRFGEATVSRTTDDLTSVGIRQDGQLLALGDAQGVVYLFRTNPVERVDSFQGHTGAVMGLAWDDGGHRLFSAGADGNMDEWNIAQRSSIMTALDRLPPSVISMRHVADNRLLAARAAVGSAQVWLWEGSRWRNIFDVLRSSQSALGRDELGEEHTESSEAARGFAPVPIPEIDNLDFDLAGNLAAWSTSDGALFTRSLDPNSQAAVVWDGAKAHAGRVQPFRLSPNGRYLALAYSGREALLFDLAAPSQSLAKHIPVPDRIRSLAFNRAETLLAMGLEDGTMSLWSVPDGRIVAGPTKLYSSAVSDVMFSSDNTLLVSNAAVGDGMQTVPLVVPVPALQPARRLFELATGDPPLQTAVEGAWLAAADFNGSVHFWDLRQTGAIGSLQASDFGLTAIALRGDANALATADLDGNVAIWRLGGAVWQATACRLANQRLSPEEWTEFVGPEAYSPACGGHASASQTR